MVVVRGPPVCGHRDPDLDGISVVGRKTLEGLSGVFRTVSGRKTS